MSLKVVKNLKKGIKLHLQILWDLKVIPIKLFSGINQITSNKK